MKTSYTITELENEFVLTDITNPDNYIHIKPEHPKFEWIAGQAGRLININEKGHFNSSKDYHGAYNKNTTAVALNTPITLTKLDDLNIDASLFTSLPTGTIFDKFCSTEGGFLPGTNVMAAGAPGVGKCVRHNTIIEVRNKKTGIVQKMTIKEFHDMIG